MFDFTTTTVVNSNQDYSTGLPLWSYQEESGEKGASFNVKRVNNFKKANVIDVFKAKATDPEMAKMTFSVTNLIAKPADITFKLVLGLSAGSMSSRYANTNGRKYRTMAFSVSVEEGMSADDFSDAFIKAFKFVLDADEKLKVSKSGGFITIEAMSEYQRFLDFEVIGYGIYSGTEKSTKNFDIFKKLEKKKTNAEVTATEDGLFIGKEGFGTYSFLLHNLRIPTSTSSSIFGIHRDEVPVVGAKYNEYIIRYCVDRGPLGTDAVGDSVKSITNHVFFVKEDISSDFETNVAKLTKEGTVTEVPKAE